MKKKNNDKKINKKSTASKAPEAKKENGTKETSPAITDCTRTSRFSAHRCGQSERRLTTYHPLFLIIPLVLALVIESIRTALLSRLAPLAASLSQTMGITVAPGVILGVLAALVLLLIIAWWRIAKGKEIRRCKKAEGICYYFYDDIIEFCEQSARKSFRAVSGIVSVKVTPASVKNLGNKLMTAIVALFSLNSKPLWQMKYGFRDVTIVTTGSSAETIILHDVHDPEALVNNIRRFYPTCTVESASNDFSL